MSLDLSSLLSRAFLVADAPRANEALAEVRTSREGSGARVRSYEVVAPDDLDDAWLEGRLVRPLVYYCESARAPLPACAGVFVALFAGGRLHCIDASEVIAFACVALGVAPEELVRRHGTGEVRHALRGDE